MHRFFIPREWIDQGKVLIKGRQVHQLRNVLRLMSGDRIIVLDNTGWEYEVELERVDRSFVSGVVRGISSVAEPKTKVTLYQALLKGSKFEFIIQRCTELGVAGFVPMVCERCVVGDLKGVSDKKLERWKRIIVEAAEQSGRGKLPILEPVVPFHEACQSARGFSLLAWEGEQTLGLRAALRGEIYRQRIISEKNPLSVKLFIGPEGGFSPSEVEFARDCGIVPIALGSRVLRAETAGLVAAAAILYECGDLEPLPSD
jgi:16S rRNA (uracil1498-N3)-methyltransferase